MQAGFYTNTDMAQRQATIKSLYLTIKPCGRGAWVVPTVRSYRALCGIGYTLAGGGTWPATAGWQAAARSHGSIAVLNAGAAHHRDAPKGTNSASAPW